MKRLLISLWILFPLLSYAQGVAVRRDEVVGIIAANPAANIVPGATLNSVNGNNILNVHGKTVFNVKAAPYNALGNNVNDDTAEIQAAATASTISDSTLGELFFPYGTYKISSHILINGIRGNTSIPNPSWNTGYGQVSGNRNTVITNTSNTNAFWIVNGMRKLKIKDITIVGTNYNHASSGGLDCNVGIALDGPGGHLTLDDVFVHSLNTGIAIQDITDCDIRNVFCASNWVGIGLEYKPDNVRIWGRFNGNEYGVMSHWTNHNYQSTVEAGQLLLSGDFGYNRVGILIPRGHARLGPLYFEANTIGIQLGMNSANGYENSYLVSGNDPNVLIDSFDANGPNDVYIYRKSQLQFLHGRRFYETSLVRLQNAAADQSTIFSDYLLNVRTSAGITLLIPQGYEYSNGSVRPRGGWEMAQNDHIVVQDEFMNGIGTQGQIGELGWGSVGGTANYLDNPGHDWGGRMKTTTGAVSNNVAAILLSTAVIPPYGSNFWSAFKFKIPNTNYSMAIVGWQSGPQAAYELNYDHGPATARRSAGAFLIYTNEMSTFWYETRVNGGGIGTRINSGVTANTNWNVLVMTKTNTTIYASLNGGAFVTIGTGALNSGAHYYTPVFGVATGVASAKSIWFDYFKFVMLRPQDQQ